MKGLEFAFALVALQRATGNVFVARISSKLKDLANASLGRAVQKLLTIVLFFALPTIRGHIAFTLNARQAIAAIALRGACGTWSLLALLIIACQAWITASREVASLVELFRFRGHITRLLEAGKALVAEEAAQTGLALFGAFDKADVWLPL